MFLYRAMPRMGRSEGGEKKVSGRGAIPIVLTHNNVAFETNNKWKYFDRVYAFRKRRKEGDVLTLWIHHRCRNVAGLL
jgi:hypothetical protein